MTNFLFNEFSPVSAKQWKQKIQADLKGADYNETLVWQSIEGIHVKPFYHQDDFNKDFSPIPGHPKTWKIAQNVFIDNEIIANKLALDAINRGAESIIFTSESEFDFTEVLHNFPFESIPIHFNFYFLSEEFNNKLKQFFLEKKATVFYNIDLLGNLARTGNWFYNLKKDHEILESIVTTKFSENIFSIDATLYQNAGANMVQQLAYAIAQANEYLNHFYNKETIKIDEKQSSVTFKIAIGSNYFFEIAKIRALRKLFAALANEYGAKQTCHIIAMPSKRNKTIYDYNVNMLRTTTECMSAILGGADTICNMPYDALYHKSNEFGERIARNQLLILKFESYFETASNPADGTYYIESLTEELAEKALLLFKDIEIAGGFHSQLKEGTIQRKIKESADKEQQLFNEGKIVLLGTNKHPNANDKMKEDLELYPFVKTNIRKTLLIPIIEKRIAENVEQERLSHE
jgi:methylmalonyl-CoA mutase